MTISLCIATYRRCERLAALLSDLAAQSVLPTEVIIVDNDAQGSARSTIEHIVAAGLPFEVHYGIQPVKNIALTRNRTVELATCDWIAFIDDDERAPPAWLELLLKAAIDHHADGVLGPVIPVVPDTAPSWIKRGSFYDFPRMNTGAIVPLNRLRFGNVLLRGSVLRAEPGPFDPNYGLMTGEDGDMLARLVKKGAKVIWNDEALVHEPVEPSRLSLRWLLQRALSGGQEFARKSLRGTYGTITKTGRMLFAVKALVQLVVSAAMTIIACPFGLHQAAQWMIKASANIGKLTVFSGWHYHEYT
ncbi:MAG: glycosyltransferase family 2 protein [Steroidobacteraceae bacterium]